jgi:hypothetical protein
MPFSPTDDIKMQRNFKTWFVEAYKSQRMVTADCLHLLSFACAWNALSLRPSFVKKC